MLNINKAITSTAITRTRVEALEDILGWSFPVLDHGFIRVIDYMGNDQAIDDAARLSYGKGTKKENLIQGLINYLMGHRHTSPFEMCEIKLHVKLPIFVMRQWVRHRTASLNEYSARYSILSNEFYIPEMEDIQKQSKSNKQGREGEFTDEEKYNIFHKLNDHSENSYSIYELLIDDKIDLARELARMSLPVNYYTEMYWKIDLHNLFHFLKLRADSHAQKEIRVYAELLEHIVKMWVPMSFDAYVNYVKKSISFSAREISLIRAALVTPNLDEKTTWASGLSDREWGAFKEKIALIKG